MRTCQGQHAVHGDVSPRCLAPSPAFVIAAFVADCAHVAEAVVHMGATERLHPIEGVRRVGSLATSRQRPPVAVMDVEMMVHPATKTVMAGKPRAGADEDSAREPFRAVVAVG